MRRFCQLVLVGCRAVAVSWIDAGGRCAVGGSDGIACRFFSFLVSSGRGDGVSSRSSSRGSVSFVLASRFSSRPSVSCWRSVLSGVSCRCLSCCAVFVSSGSRGVSSFLVAVVASFRVRPVVRVGWRLVVVALRRGVALRYVWRYAIRGGGMCGARRGGGTGGGTHGEMSGGAMGAPFLSARFGCSHVVLARRGVLGEFSAFSTVE